MAIVELQIGRSKYKIECPENEKPKLIHLAHKLNERVAKLNFSHVDEKTLLVIAGLMIEDDLENSGHALNKINDSASEDEINKLDENDIYAAITQNIENIADYIETLAKKIEKR